MSRPLDPTSTSQGSRDTDDTPEVSVHFLVPLGAAPIPHALLHQLTADPGPWRVSLLVDDEDGSVDDARHAGAGPADPRIEWCRVTDADTLATLIAGSTATHVALLDRADRLAEPGGAHAWVRAAARHRGASVVVGDELRTGSWRSERIFTPVPDRFSALVRPWTSGPLMLAIDDVRRIDPGAVHGIDHLWAELVRRLTEDGGAVRQDSVLLVRDGARPRPSLQVRREWAATVGPQNVDVVATADGELHLVGPGDSRGTVSVILPTIGASGTVHGGQRVFVTALLDELRSAGHDELGEIVVVVDSATPAEVRTELEQVAAGAAAAESGVPVRLVEDPESAFDFSRKVNLGVAHAHGEVLLLLNDDVEGLSEHWVGSMCDLLRIDGVGIVGATLLYEDDTVQHAGVVGVEGIAGHFGQARPWSSDFADGRWREDRPSLAVTGACLMTTRTVWDRVGGFSRALPVNYNDLDFCLKARQLGLDVLVAGTARLRHFESRSRVARVEPSEYRALAARWYDQLVLDPYHPGGFDVVAPQNGEEHVWPSRA